VQIKCTKKCKVKGAGGKHYDELPRIGGKAVGMATTGNLGLITRVNTAIPFPSDGRVPAAACDFPLFTSRRESYEWRTAQSNQPTSQTPAKQPR